MTKEAFLTIILNIKSLAIMSLLLLFMGCQSPLYKVEKYDHSRAVVERKEIDFKFSIAGTDSKKVQSIVPAENRAPSYIWDKVPNSESPIQMLRSCNYYEFYGTRPVNSNRWWCWDKTEKKLRHYEAGDDFANVVAFQPGWIWMISNEPNVKSQDNLTPQEYAEFFGWVAKTIAQLMLRNKYPAFPRLVFCQASANPSYCEAAYFHLKEMVADGHWPDWPENLKVEDSIWALSVHHYIDDRFPLTENNLNAAFEEWKDEMNNFVVWSNTVDAGALKAKALWVTEFGVLESFCIENQDLRPKVDKKGGVSCPAPARRNNGQMNDDFVFYGRNEREGIWGLQHKVIEYFLNRTHNSHHNQGDWQAAWWFTSKMGDWDLDGECDRTVWLFGDETICIQDQNKLTRAAKTYRNTINCAARGEDCPKF